MSDDELIKRYNYDSFVPDNFMPWMRFEASPTLGDPAPDFPLWDLAEREVSLSSLWNEHLYTIVEFGSYT
jgi:hypothetical protein